MSPSPFKVIDFGAKHPGNSAEEDRIFTQSRKADAEAPPEENENLKSNYSTLLLFAPLRLPCASALNSGSRSESALAPLSLGQETYP
jgi:hypothetical protein